MGTTQSPSPQKYLSKTCCGQCTITKITINLTNFNINYQNQNHTRKNSPPQIFISQLNQASQKLCKSSVLTHQSPFSLFIKDCCKQKHINLNISLLDHEGKKQAQTLIHIIEGQLGQTPITKKFQLMEIDGQKIVGEILLAIHQEQIEVQQYLFKVQHALLRFKKDQCESFLVEIDTGIDLLVFYPQKIANGQHINPWQKTQCGRVQSSNSIGKQMTVKFIDYSKKKEKVIGRAEFIFHCIENKISKDLIVRKKVEKKAEIIGMVNLGMMPGNIPEAMLPPSSPCKIEKRKYSSPVKIEKKNNITAQIMRQIRKRSLHFPKGMDCQ